MANMINMLNFFNNKEYPFITREYYIDRANIIILKKDDMHKLKNSNIVANIIIFIDSKLLYDMIEMLLKITVNFILITCSNSDYCIPYLVHPNIRYYKITELLLNKVNLIKWYTTNPSTIHKKIVPVFIGPKIQWKSTQFFGEDNSYIKSIYMKYYNLSYNLFKNKRTTNKLLYFNFDVNTTKSPHYNEHRNIRPKINKILLENKFKPNMKKEFKDYMEELKEYKFSISPPGNAIDAHRTWESLIVGTIPIVLQSPLHIQDTNNMHFNKLPILIVDCYSVITSDYLCQKYDEIIKKDYDFNVLYCCYWNDIIK